MKILVTGGAGFIGSHLVERLLALGHRVVCVDNFDDYYDPGVKRDNLATARKSANFGLVEGDILDQALVEELLSARYNILVHLAARAGVRLSIQRPDLYERVNVQGTINLLEASRRHSIQHFVFGSSSSVYGLSTNIPFKEDDYRLLPASPYAVSKVAAEHFCYTFHHLYGFPVTCLRFFTVYGPRQRPDMAIHRFTRLIENGEPVPMYGDGTARRDYTYVDDAVDGIVRAIARPDGCQTYNIGSSQTVTLRDLISIIGHALDRTPIISPQPNQPGDVPITCASIARAQRHLEYAPDVKIAAGIQRFVKWYRVQRSAASAIGRGGK